MRLWRWPRTRRSGRCARRTRRGPTQRTLRSSAWMRLTWSCIGERGRSELIARSKPADLRDQAWRGPAAMADAIVEMATNEAQRKVCAENAKRAYAEDFTLERMDAAYVELYRRTRAK